MAKMTDEQVRTRHLNYGCSDRRQKKRTLRAAYISAQRGIKLICKGCAKDLLAAYASGDPMLLASMMRRSELAINRKHQLSKLWDEHNAEPISVPARTRLEQLLNLRAGSRVGGRMLNELIRQRRQLTRADKVERDQREALKNKERLNRLRGREAPPRTTYEGPESNILNIPRG